MRKKEERKKSHKIMMKTATTKMKMVLRSSGAGAPCRALGGNRTLAGCRKNSALVLSLSSSRSCKCCASSCTCTRTSNVSNFLSSRLGRKGSRVVAFSLEKKGRETEKGFASPVEDKEEGAKDALASTSESSKPLGDKVFAELSPAQALKASKEKDSKDELRFSVTKGITEEDIAAMQKYAQSEGIERIFRGALIEARLIEWPGPPEVRREREERGKERKLELPFSFVSLFFNPFFLVFSCVFFVLHSVALFACLSC